MILGSARQAAQNHGIPLWVDIQAFGEFLADDSTLEFQDTWNSIPGPRDSGLPDEGIWREPTEREFKCQSWLALAYGAKGLDYWQLKSNRANLGSKYIYTMGLLSWDKDDTSAHAGPPYRAEFYHAQDFFKNTLQKIGPTLVSLNSDAVGKSSNLPVGFVTDCSDSLLHFGTFTGPRGLSFIVVNRHCLPTEFMTPSVTLDLPASPAGSYYLLDEVSGEAIAPVSGSGGGSFRYLVHLAPGEGRLLRVVPFAGSVVRNQGQAFSNLMQVALHPGYGDGSDSPVDSMRIYCQHTEPQDTVETDWTVTDSTTWIGYRADWVGRARLEGWNRFGARYRLHDGTNTPTYWSAPITIDTSAPHDSMNINHNAWSTTSALCTLCSYVSDGNSGPGQMQFTNDCMTNPALSADPGMTDSAYWACKNCELVDSLGVARMEIPDNSESYLYHRIPTESIQQYQGWQMMLSGDIVSDSFAGGAALQLQFCYVPDSEEFGHDTIVVSQPLLPIEPGTVARVSTYNYSVQFPFFPAPPANYRLWAVDVGVFAAPRTAPGGKLWIDNVALELVLPEPAPNPSGWLPYQAEFYPWFIGPNPGVYVVKAGCQDQAGNEGVWVADVIYLLPSGPPSADFRINPGPCRPNGMAMTNMPEVILWSNVGYPPFLTPDSMKVSQYYYALPTDTLPIVDQYNWMAFRQERVWPLNYGGGRYRLEVRYMTCIEPNNPDTTLVLSDSVCLDLVSPQGSIIANAGRETLTCAQCSVATAASDSGTGLAMMRLCDWPLTLLQNSSFSQGLNGWQSANVILDTGPNYSFIEMDAPTDTTDTLVYLSQVIPPERFTGISVWNNQLRLNMDVATDSLVTACNLEFDYLWVKIDTSVAGPDTMVACQQQVQLPCGYTSWAGANPISLFFMYNQMTPPQGYSSAGAIVRVHFSPPYSGGRIFLDNLNLDVMAGWMANPTHQQGNWEPYDSLKLCYMSGMWGKKTLHAQVQDFAGNVSPEMTSDTVYLPRNCPTCMQFSINTGPCAACEIKKTNMPEVLLMSEVGFPPTEYADSLKVGRWYYSSLTDSTPAASWSNWLFYRHEQFWRLDSGEGKYRFNVRYMLGAATGGDTNLVLSDSCYLALNPPSGNILANRGRWFLGSAGQCTLALTVSDSACGTGLRQMRFGDDGLSVLENSGFSQELIGWQTSHVTLDSGPGYCMAVLTAPGDTMDTLAFIEQPISPEWAAKLAAWNAQLRVSADVITESLATQGAMGFIQRWIKTDTAWAGPDTMEWLVSQTGLPFGNSNQTGMNPMSLWTQYNLVMPPPEHYAFNGLFARIRLSRPFGGGKVLLDNFGIQIVGGWGYQMANWQPYDSLRFYQLSGMPGKRTVHAQLQDYAGNGSQDLVSDTFNFDPIPPFASIVFPNRGQIVGNSDSLVEVLGLALDPPFPEDPMESQYHLSHFKDYKLCWKPATAVWGDSTYGILPESLFYQAALPPPSESAGLLPPWRHLAWWNTKALTDQYGYGYYQLILTAEDSAGNTTMTQISVQLDSFGSECASQGTDSGASCIAMNTTANQFCVGFTSGDLVSYSSTLDSISALTLYDSAGPVVFAGLAVDTIGAFWVADARDQDVKRFDAQGAATDTLGECAQPTAPQGIALVRNGDVWVADSLRNVIDVYAVDHSLKRSFGSTGTDTGQFEGAYGVALSYTTNLSLTLHFDPAGNPGFDTTRTTLVRCLVADKGNSRIQVFDTTGHYLTSFGDSILNQPVALSIDTNNCCYVADIGKHEVCCFSPNGRLYLTATSADTMQPVATALSPDNLNLYALDQKTNRLIKYVVLNSDSGFFGGAMSGGVNPLLIPKELILYQSRPNPATRSLTIRYGIPRRTNVSLKVYDITGKLVRTLETNDKLRPGYYNTLWNCRDNRDRQVAGGVYFYRLVTSDIQITTKGKVSAGVKTRKLVIAR
jgi:hypothetical protein